MSVFFLYPVFLLGLLAASLPVLIHLLNRRKLKRIRFPAVRFILLSQKRISRSYRLRHWILLALRTLAVVFLALGSLLAAALYYEQSVNTAVVVVPNTVVRYGPLDESNVFYQLRDGSELQVLDKKTTAENQSWLMVQDAAHRTGWLKRQEVVVLNGRESRS